jgi:uncharacterized protein (TIGR03086 family)
VALDELVVHGWDIARSTGQPFEADDGHLREIEATVTQLRAGNDGEIPGLFGAAVAPPAGATPLERVLALIRLGRRDPLRSLRQGWGYAE